MVCLLYTDVLCLASAGKADVMYTIHACIHIDRARIEDPDSGRGRQHMLRETVFCFTKYHFRLTVSQRTILLEIGL